MGTPVTNRGGLSPNQATELSQLYEALEGPPDARLPLGIGGRSVAPCPGRPPAWCREPFAPHVPYRAMFLSGPL